MKKEDVVKKLIDPLKTTRPARELKKAYKNAKHGLWCNSPFLRKSYGCERCAVKEHCEDYPHANGICIRRGKMYIEYFKAGKGDVVPLMIDQLAKVSTEMDIEHEKGIGLGKMTEEYFRLNYLSMQLKERINKATEGIKMKVEHTYFDEMRTIITEKVVEVKDESQPGDSY